MTSSAVSARPETVPLKRDSPAPVGPERGCCL